jgi:hypothetical protein
LAQRAASRCFQSLRRAIEGRVVMQMVLSGARWLGSSSRATDTKTGPDEWITLTIGFAPSSSTCDSHLRRWD